MLKKTVFVLMFIIPSICIASPIIIPDDGKIMSLSGVVSRKPMVKSDSSFKAYYLKLDKELTFNDDANCGEQTQKSIAINSFDMKKYAGKRVVISGNVFCQTQYTGNYHIEDVKITIK